LFVDFKVKSEQKALKELLSMGCTVQNNEKFSRWRNWQKRERRALVETSMKVEGVQNYSVQYKGYNLIRVTIVERGDGQGVVRMERNSALQQGESVARVPL
jgi:hypothetical protein